MSDFDNLFQALDKIKLRMPPDKVSRVRVSCSHSSITNVDDLSICEDCGEEINRILSHDKEWRYYGSNDSKHTSDPNRVQTRKIEERTIFKDVENMGLCDKIIDDANKLYVKVTKDGIYRGNTRRGIVFACVYMMYNINKNHQDHDKLIETFKINRKIALKGLRHVTRNASKESIKISITPNDLITQIMNSFKATDEQKNQVMELYEKIKNKSSKLNRSRPQSVASGLIYYWIKMMNVLINLKDFAEQTKLSELTIVNIAKEISVILETDNIF